MKEEEEIISLLCRVSSTLLFSLSFCSFLSYVHEKKYHAATLYKFRPGLPGLGNIFPSARLNGNILQKVPDIEQRFIPEMIGRPFEKLGHAPPFFIPD